LSFTPGVLASPSDLTDAVAIFVIAVGMAGAAILILFAKRKI